MSLPLYQDNHVPNALPGDGHAGLWWDKFFCHYDQAWKIPKPNPRGNRPAELLGGKTAWIHSVCGERGEQKSLENFVKRQYMLGSALEAEQRVFATDWRFVTGLGLSHPVENGFAWHPTLGVPYLPASGVKGLLRAWMEEWAGEEESREKIPLWFGNTEVDHETAGSLIFFDAVPTGKVRLVADVVTPHDGKWRESGASMDGSANDAERLPADYHSPVPVPFLVVEQAAFLFQIAPRPGSEANAETAREAMEALKEALMELGAGAKTAAGYGRLLEQDRSIITSWQAERQKQHEEQRRQSLSPLERKREELLAQKADKNMPDEIELINKIGEFTEEEQQTLAGELKAWLEANNKWIPESSKPQKDKDYKRTRKLMQVLGEG